MLKLSHLSPFASGGRRYCFVHPHDSTKCVKVLKPDLPITKNILAKKRLRRKVIMWFELYVRPPSKYKYGLLGRSREFYEHRRLANLGEENVWRHVPRHFGLIETDMGPASVVEMVCNYDGTVAPTLKDKIQSGELPEQALAELRYFLQYLALPYWSDSHVENLICARIDASDRERLFIVDGMDCSKINLIRSRLLTSHLRRHALKNCQKFEEKLAAAIEEQRCATC